MNDEAIQHMLDVLNRAISADPVAIANLIEHRVPCNQQLANDPTIQVSSYRGDGFTIGMLGVICGIAGCHEDGYAKIAAVFSTECPRHGKVSAAVGESCPKVGCAEIVRLGSLEGFERTRVHIGNEVDDDHDK